MGLAHEYDDHARMAPEPELSDDTAVNGDRGIRPSGVAVPPNPYRALVTPQLWRACAHLATDGLMSLAGLAVLVTLGTALCLVPVGLTGVPLVLVAGWALHGLGVAERYRWAAIHGLDFPEQPRPSLSGPLLRSAVSLANDRSTWRLIAYFAVLAPLSLLTFLAILLVWGVPLALVLLPVYYTRLSSGRAALGPLTVDDPGTALLVAALALLACASLSPLVVRALLAVDVRLARTLLAPPRDMELAKRVEYLTESRARVVDAAEAERRRIERDLHDGAQQRLVAMTMTLGRARSRLKDSGQDAALELVEDARRSAQEAIIELRDLTRGLHPPVLTDRGLDAALSAVAARSPIPVTVDVQVTPRPSATLEGMAYFVVTEALTNVAKHAGATTAWVVIRRAGNRLITTIGDDGTGGAKVASGGGLAGLADRVSGVDGQVRVTSPPGGPTLIEVDMQCA
ncbi:sensor histidine kinase [Streptomyces sp. NPDC052494]|uniref:sensor histidine kinase n=1 Tax=Streptomyces sp. NPDC052494 TaxID=3365692 RepID=UPI0037D7C648